MVGLGPGDWREMTLRADEALRAADAIVGYALYVELIRERYPGKDFHTTAMRGEVEPMTYAGKPVWEGFEGFEC